MQQPQVSKEHTVGCKKKHTILYLHVQGYSLSPWQKYYNNKEWWLAGEQLQCFERKICRENVELFLHVKRRLSFETFQMLSICPKHEIMLYCQHCTLCYACVQLNTRTENKWHFNTKPQLSLSLWKLDILFYAYPYCCVNIL